jgi:hypothetical protein
MPTTYFAEDWPGAGEATRIAHPNSDAKQTEFLAAIVSLGTESFEGIADDTPAPLDITFGSLTATLQGGGFVDEVFSPSTNGSGRYPTHGDKFWDSRNDFSIDFDTPISAFGFKAVDVGDFNGRLTLTLTHTDLSTTILTVPHSFHPGPPPFTVWGGAVLYYGFKLDPGELGVTSIEFGNSSVGFDVFAFDEMDVAVFVEDLPPIPTGLSECGPSLGPESCPQSCPIPTPTWIPQVYTPTVSCFPTGLTACGHSLGRQSC